MMKKYTIKQNLTDSEKYKFTLLILIRANMVRKILLIVLLPFIFISIINGIMLGLGSNIDDSSTNILSVLIFPFILLILFTVGPLILIKFKKMDTSTFEFDDWGMAIINENKTMNYPWTEISYYSELSNALLITVGKNKLNTHIIPKRDFNSLDELRDFIDLLNRKNIKRI